MNNCLNCKFYLHIPQLCRRFPPKVVAWKNPSPKRPEDEIIIRSQFPVMLPDGWCGEHRTK